MSSKPDHYFPTTKREHNDIVGVLAEITCGDIIFKAEHAEVGFATGEGVTIMYACAKRPCNVAGGEAEEQYGRPWIIPSSYPYDQIVRTCMLAALTFEEHETREKLLVNGERPFMPSH